MKRITVRRIKGGIYLFVILVITVIVTHCVDNVILKNHYHETVQAMKKSYTNGFKTGAMWYNINFGGQRPAYGVIGDAAETYWHGIIEEAQK